MKKTRKSEKNTKNRVLGKRPKKRPRSHRGEKWVFFTIEKCQKSAKNRVFSTPFSGPQKVSFLTKFNFFDKIIYE